MRVRLLINKSEDLIFLSHLEWMKLWERMFSIASIHLCHSQGFNPRPLMSFDLPLAVGMEAERCYLDIEVEEDFSLSDLDRLVFPPGLQLLGCQFTEDVPLMGVVSSATFFLKGDPKGIQSLRTDEALPFLKHSKKGPRPQNARDYIRRYEIHEDGLWVELKAGSQENLKPMDLLRALGQTPEEIHSWEIRRLDVFDAEGRSLWER